MAAAPNGRRLFQGAPTHNGCGRAMLQKLAESRRSPKPAEKPDDAVVRSCKQSFLPSVRISTAFACKLIVLTQRKIGEDT